MHWAPSSQQWALWLTAQGGLLKKGLNVWGVRVDKCMLWRRCRSLNRPHCRTHSIRRSIVTKASSAAWLAKSASARNPRPMPKLDLPMLCRPATQSSGPAGLPLKSVRALSTWSRYGRALLFRVGPGVPRNAFTPVLYKPRMPP